MHFMATFNGDNRIFPLELIFVTFAHTAHSKKSFFFCPILLTRDLFSHILQIGTGCIVRAMHVVVQ